MNDIFTNCSPIFEQIFFPKNVHKIQCVSLLQNTKGGDDINGNVAFKVELIGIGEKIVETFGTSQIHFKIYAKIFKFLLEFGVFCADPNPLLTLSEDFNSQRKFHCLSTAQTTTTTFAFLNKMAENELVLSSDDDNSQHSSSKEEKETSNVIMDAEEEYARAAPGTSNSNKRKATKRGNKDGAPKEKKAKKSKKATNFAELAKNAGDDTGLEEMKKILKGELDSGKLTKAKKANKKATKKEEEKMPAKSKEKKKATKKVAAKESSEDSDSTSEWDSDEDKEDSSDDEKEEEDSSDESGEIVKEEEEEEEESDELLARAKQHVKKDQGIYGDLLKPTIAHCLTFGQCKGCATYQKEKMLEPIVNRPIVGRVAQLVQCRECLRANTNMIGIGQQFFGQNDDLKEHTAYRYPDSDDYKILRPRYMIQFGQCTFCRSRSNKKVGVIVEKAKKKNLHLVNVPTCSNCCFANKALINQYWKAFGTFAAKKKD